MTILRVDGRARKNSFSQTIKTGANTARIICNTATLRRQEHTASRQQVKYQKISTTLNIEADRILAAAKSLARGFPKQWPRHQSVISRLKNVLLVVETKFDSNTRTMLRGPISAFLLLPGMLAIFLGTTIDAFGVKIAATKTQLHVAHSSSLIPDWDGELTDEDEEMIRQIRGPAGLAIPRQLPKAIYILSDTTGVVRLVLPRGLAILCVQFAHLLLTLKDGSIGRRKVPRPI